MTREYVLTAAHVAHDAKNVDQSPLDALQQDLDALKTTIANSPCLPLSRYILADQEQLLHQIDVIRASLLRVIMSLSERELRSLNLDEQAEELDTYRQEVQFLRELVETLAANPKDKPQPFLGNQLQP